MFRSAKALDRAKTHASFRQAMASYHKTAESWYDGSVDAVDRRIAHVDKLLHHIRATVARMDFADSATQLREAQTLSADRSALVEFKRTLLTGAADYSMWGKTAGAHDLGYYDNNPDASIGQPMDKVNPYRGNTGRRPRPSYRPDTGESNTGASSSFRGIPLGHEEAYWPNPKGTPTGQGKHRAEAALDGLPPSDRRWVTLESSRFVSANTDCLSDPEELATRAQHHAAIKTSTFTRQHSAEVTRAFVSSVVELGKKTYRPSPVKTAAVDIGFDPEALFL